MTVLVTDAVIETLVLFLFSKFTISASFLIIYPFAGELYPTPLRGVGIGFSAYVAGLGLILIPFVTYLVSYLMSNSQPSIVYILFTINNLIFVFKGRENLVLPLVIMGLISIIGAFTALRLPETLHHNLPQTIEEGEQFGKEWTFADCLSCPNK